MIKKKQKGNLSIELLPEFGLSLNGEPVYCPGSVFQGIVRLSLPQQQQQHNAQRLRIIFHAAESVQLHSTMASVIRGRHHQLFGSQRILWEKSTDSPFPSNQYIFTIQMPLVQHPPSMDYARLRYKCRFKLTAILDHQPSSSSSLQPLLTTHQSVHYRPWIPTRALKIPMVRHSKWLVVQMPNTDYVAGDTFQFQVTLSPSALASCIKSSLVGMQVIMELVQIVTLPCQLEDERVPPSETTVTRSTPIVIHSPPISLLLLDQQQQSSYRRTSISSSSPSLVQSCIQTCTRLSMKIPSNLPPSYHYGRVITVQYELVLHVSGKKRQRSLWTSIGEDEIRIPLVIGTLGHGIRIPDDLSNYTDYSGIFGDTRSSANTLTRIPSSTPSIVSQQENNSSSIDNNNNNNTHSLQTVPPPKFLQTIEYENALPTYHPSTLPPYTASTSCTQCISV
ncbi:uncharacterized protein BX664DRAFT_327449 [Halteromyces radiatus]|uniref:uncharacterized protein n=1 Tax=Halteromyces radiatus TaxID=101107 RepID=UPI002220731E|nr:uncharacterized protein BX664DRAFT_327449 [Halteromyces radiatus]KAI8092508.1 hypothetical protein BX664DRAFT_327449 [Halteromyces radiatus]